DSAVAQWSAQAWAKTSRLTGQSFASILQRRVPSHAANSATSAAGTGAWLDTRANLRDVRAIANRGQLEAGPHRPRQRPGEMNDRRIHTNQQIEVHHQRRG